MSGVHGVGAHAPSHVEAAHRVAPGPSLNRLPMEAQIALEKPQLLSHATQIVAQVTFHDYIFSVHY